jgi:hypothetical protein
MKTWTLGNEKLTATITQQEKWLEIQLTDDATGQAWGPVRLLDLEAYSKAEFRAETVSEYRVDRIEEDDCGLHVVLGNTMRGIRLGIWLRIEEGELVVRMPIPEVYEDRAHCFRLFSVILMPDLMTTGSEGELFLPLNTGCLTKPAGKPKLKDRFMIYGEQTRWELLPTLPVTAVRDPEGGIMAMATEGAHESEVHVATDGKGSGQVGFGMSLRQFWPDTVEWATREIRFRPIAKTEDFLSSIAGRLRRHVMDDLGKPALKQRVEESPELAYMVNGYTMKLFYAVENCGIMMAKKEQKDWVTFKAVMSFAEAEEGLKKLHDAGVDKIYTQSVGWNANGHDGLFPSFFPVEERLGGEAAFRRLIATGNAMGYLMNVHDNKLAAVKRSPEYQEDDMVHDQWGQPMGLGEWGGGTTFVPNMLLKSEEEITESMREIQDLGLKGMGYLDGMGNPLYRNYHPRHKFSRTAYATMTNRLIEISKQVYGAAGTECGFMYCAIPADSMCTGGEEWQWNSCWEEWPVTQLMDQRVPLYRLVFGGLMFQECQGVTWNSVMECVLLGKHPRDEWSTRPGVMPLLTDERIAQIKAVYDIALQRFGHLQLEEITSWKEAEDGTQTSTYADGTVVTANKKTGVLTVNGETIERPEAL